MAADFNKPTVDSVYTNVISEINDKFTDLSKGLDTGATNLPEGAIRFSDTNSRWEKLVSGTWTNLKSLFQISVRWLNGYEANTAAVASTIPVRDSTGKLPGDITGNAATATLASSANAVAWGNVSGKPSNFVYSDSGTYSINVSGSAGSVAWGNVSGKPGNFVYNDSGTYSINISGNANYANSAGSVTWGNVSGKPALVNNDGGTYGINISGRGFPKKADGGDLNFNWSGQAGQPTWLWGGSDGSNMYVWNPSNFNVNYANSAGNADTVDGWHRDDLRNWGSLLNKPSLAAGGSGFYWEQVWGTANITSSINLVANWGHGIYLVVYSGGVRAFITTGTGVTGNGTNNDIQAFDTINVIVNSATIYKLAKS